MFGLFNKRKSPQEIAEFISSKNAVILDCRTMGEYAEGHIDGCKHIPVDQIAGKIAEIKSWDKPVVVYCRSGGRAGTAESIMKNNGIEAVNGGGYGDMLQIVR